MLRIEAVLADLTLERVDAIVNAANSTLLGGGGVDGAIHAAAGPQLLAECRRLRRTTHPQGLAPGDAVATGAGDLAARWVIHTVGPNRHRGQTDPAVLASCFTRSLEVARELPARSVAFPAIGAGAYGWEVAEVARIAVQALRGWGEEFPTAQDGGPPVAAVQDGVPPVAVELVRLVAYSPAALAAFTAALAAR